MGFSDHGYTVIACGRHPPEHPPWEFLTCDVREPEQVRAMVSVAVERHGRLDVVVNNAGGTPSTPAASMSPHLAERVVALNLLGPFYVSQAANEVMQAQASGGLILNIGSAAALRPAKGSAPYNAAKAGLGSLTRSLALEWAPKVRVNMVTVGLLQTESVRDTYGEAIEAVARTVPMGRMATPADVAAACLMFASPDLAYVTGAELVVDGGGEEPSFTFALRGAGKWT
jgi:NAD(P)-dependent dehydrogenase (short-subunit alcohol dehydrogenase family)